MPAALLLGRGDNPHVEALLASLPKHGFEGRVLDPRRFPRDTTLSIRVAPGKGPRIDTDLVDMEGVRVGWFSSQESVRVSAAVARRARAFARAAAVSAMLSLQQVGGIAWVNDPWRARSSADKVWQSLVARRHGLSIPDTLLTNDPAAFEHFVRQHKGAAVKSPSGSAGLVESRRILTQLVQDSDLSDAASVRYAPVLAQKYIEKRTEIRATVVAGKVYAVEIHSQATPATRIDWRRYDARTPHDRCSLPKKVEKACVSVTRACGLEYSGIDLIRTPGDEYVFLEANSEPAWLWVEDKTGFPITDAIARLLARKGRAWKEDRVP